MTQGPDGRIAWFHCFAGIAGDMALGSLIDAGADLEIVIGMLRGLDLDGWEIEANKVLRCGISATAINVKVTDHASSRTYSDIVELIEAGSLPQRVAARSLSIFGRLAEVEGRLHGVVVQDVHFHEVGAHDSIIDIVGVAAALECLGVEEVRASPVSVGTGMIRSAHGLIPNPAPAVVELLAGAPVVGRPLEMELTTPTGAAVLAALCSGYGPMPAMVVEMAGFGAGSAELPEMPNATQVVVGRRIGGPSVISRQAGSAVEGGDGPEAAYEDFDWWQLGGQPVVLLEANVDDATAETIAYAVDRLIGAGAHDAWVVPVTMKKGRPGHVVCALADVSLAADLREILRRETGSIGVRGGIHSRWPTSRSMHLVEVAGFRVGIKVSGTRAKAEHDDVATVAVNTGRPLREIAAEAEALWWASQSKDAPG